MTRGELDYLLTLKKTIDSLNEIKPALNTSSEPDDNDFGRAAIESLSRLLNRPDIIYSHPDIGKVIRDTFKVLDDGLNQYKKRKEIELASISIIKPEDFHG